MDQPKKKGKKLLRYGLYLVVIFLLIIVLPPLFYHQEINTLPMSSGYVKGVYHVHSNFSDGKGSVDEITRAAKLAKQDFIILTDHGEPNQMCSKSTSWMNDVLLIGGSELSLNSGHLAVFGFKVPNYRFPPEPQEAIDDINRDQGVSFISHPFDDKIPWTDWDIHEFSGIEVFNSYSFARKRGWFKLLIFPLQYLFNKRYALLKTLYYPQRHIDFWDSLNQSGKYLAIYACDAHAVLPVSRNIKLHFPSYQSMFEIFNTYVKIDRNLSQDPHQSASIITEAIKQGHFFNVVEAIAPANGFKIHFANSTGDILEMGESTGTTEGTIHLRLPFDFETDIVIKKDGTLFQKTTRNLKKNLSYKISGPGIYRAEIFVSNNSFRKIPWILTNPFYIGKEYPDRPRQRHLISKLLVNREDFFSIETNSMSSGSVSTRQLTTQDWQTRFDYELKKTSDQKDFWAALTARNRFDLSNYSGFAFQSRGKNISRLWIEFRTRTQQGESWFRHSFLVEPDWNHHSIPFHKFHLIHGPVVKPDMSKIYAIFISINNAIAYPDTQGTIQLNNLGLY